MPTLALISNDTTLAEELRDALRDGAWSVVLLDSATDEDALGMYEVVAVDASDQVAVARAGSCERPVIAIGALGLPVLDNPRADDVLFRPLRREEVVARLDRLVARSPREELRRRDAKTFASLAVGIVVLGPNSDIVFANPRAFEIVGQGEQRLDPDGIRELVATDELSAVRRALVDDRYPRGIDVRLSRRDGTSIICNCSFAPLMGAEDHTVISFDDVTDQRDTERELLKTMEFLKSLIDASVDAIVATDMEQRVVLFNPSAEKISGLHVADVLGNITLADLLGRASAELVIQRLLSPDHGGEGRLEPTMLDFHDLHGERIPVQLSASLIHEHERPSAIVLIFADLRDRLRVEERLAEAQKKLAFTEKQGVLAELAGTAAHELNQPLTSMMAYAELLLRQSEPGSTPAKAAEVLIQEAERMADIVRKIGKITRYETTAYVGHQKIFDLDRAADSRGDPGTKG